MPTRLRKLPADYGHFSVQALMRLIPAGRNCIPGNPVNKKVFTAVSFRVLIDSQSTSWYFMRCKAIHYRSRLRWSKFNSDASILHAKNYWYMTNQPKIKHAQKPKSQPSLLTSYTHLGNVNTVALSIFLFQLASKFFVINTQSFKLLNKFICRFRLRRFWHTINQTSWSTLSPIARL